VTRCPECDAEIDLDEDEVEEGEILSCPECESELEVTQTHPVHLNVLSDEDDDEEEGTDDASDDDDEEDEEEEGDESGHDVTEDGE
jgi:alpha-aminoadipate/glutamate carrier protein LysW